MANPDLSRRAFLSFIAKSLSGLAALAVGVPGLGHLLAPLRARTGAGKEYHPLGYTFGFTEKDEPRLVFFKEKSRDGWEEVELQRSAWVVRTGPQEVKALSPICPHLGCAVGWDSYKKRFACPCHNSVFDRAGRVVSGPAPRPMDALPTKVDGATLLARWQEYRTGNSKSEPL